MSGENTSPGQVRPLNSSNKVILTSRLNGSDQCGGNRTPSLRSGLCLFSPGSRNGGRRRAVCLQRPLRPSGGPGCWAPAEPVPESPSPVLNHCGPLVSPPRLSEVSPGRGVDLFIIYRLLNKLPPPPPLNSRQVGRVSSRLPRPGPCLHSGPRRRRWNSGKMAR